MAKTKFSIKLTGLEIEYEGERDDVSKITGAVGKQFGEILQTPSVVAGPSRRLPASVVATDVDSGSQMANTKKGSGAKKTTSRKPKEPPVEWSHDAEGWGNPLQGWKIRQKALWLLYVIQNVTETTEMSASRVASTFNEYFREAGQLKANLVGREFRRASKSSPPSVQQSVAGDWFLTEEGKSQATELVKRARGIE